MHKQNGWDCIKIVIVEVFLVTDFCVGLLIYYHLQLLIILNTSEEELIQNGQIDPRIGDRVAILLPPVGVCSLIHLCVCWCWLLQQKKMFVWENCIGLRSDRSHSRALPSKRHCLLLKRNRWNPLCLFLPLTRYLFTASSDCINLSPTATISCTGNPTR